MVSGKKKTKTKVVVAPGKTGARVRNRGDFTVT